MEREQIMIYMDHGATTKISESALLQMQPYYELQYANPSATYRFASKSAAALQKAREEIAKRIHAKPEEIYFTGGGTLGNNQVFQMVCETYREEKGHIIVGGAEHSSVLKCIPYLESRGFRVTKIMPDEEGRITPDRVEKELRPDTRMISVQLANHEVGSINEIEKIGQLARARHILLHTDAVAAAGYVKMDVEALQVDLLTTAAHKFEGPVGVGFLYMRKDLKLAKVYFGGNQEGGYFPGTENVPAIRGMMQAFVDRQDHLEEVKEQLIHLREYFLVKLLMEIPQARINGSRVHRLAGNVHFSIPGISGDRLVMYLDMDEIYVSTGSACNSRDGKASPVLTAMGIKAPYLDGSIRVTLSPSNTKEEIDFVIDRIKTHMQRC